MTASLQVLVVEDDELYAHALARMLRNTTAEPIIALTLTDALANLSTQLFDVILTDLNLPDSRGMQTAHAILRAAPRTPIIVLTAEDDEALGLQTVQAGAQDYLLKPDVDPRTLERSMAYARERKRLQQEATRIAEEMRRQNEEMRSDLRMAREIQRAMLPAGAGRTNGRVTISHRLMSIAPVGGDFFVESCSPEGLSAVLICDVMGHGVRAALITSLLRALVDATSLLAVGPTQLLTQLNEKLRGIFREAEQQIFVTALCVTVDPSERRLRFASAGHPNPVLIDRERKKVTTLEARRGLPLGIADATGWATSIAAIEPGQRVLLFTDGLYEVEGAKGEQFGLARLHEAFSRSTGSPTEDLLADVIAAAQAYSPSDSFNDDVCVVSMELNAR